MGLCGTTWGVGAALRLHRVSGCCIEVECQGGHGNCVEAVYRRSGPV